MFIVNLIPVFAPEIGFDALWYHLTLPKLWLTTGQYYFPGRLLYYSAMPRLTETLFTPLLYFLGTTGPKLLQYLSGLATTFVIFSFLRKRQSFIVAVSGASFFYATHLVGWQGSSAYIDLFRTLLETLAIVTYLSSYKNKLLLSALFWSLSIGSKWNSIVSLTAFAFLFDLRLLPLGLLPALPWFMISFYFTGNPVFPLLSSEFTASQFQAVGKNFFSPLIITTRFIRLPLSLLFPFDDWLSPAVALLSLPTVFISLVSRDKLIRRLGLYSFAMILVWQLTPPPSTRYLLPVLPVIAIILSLYPWGRLRWFISSILITSILVVLPIRAIAVSKFLPVVLGIVSDTQFLEDHKAKLPGTFVDTDGFVSGLPPSSTILTDFHNLYYFDRPITHLDWADVGTHYDYFITASPSSSAGTLIHQSTWPAYVYQTP